MVARTPTPGKTDRTIRVQPGNADAHITMGGIKVDSTRLIAILFPLIASLLTWGLGLALHWQLGQPGPEQSVTSVFLAVATGVVGTVGWLATGARTKLIRVTVLATIVTTGLGLIALLIFGLSWATTYVYWLPALTLTAVWNVLYLPSVRGTGEPAIPGGGLEHQLGLTGSRSVLLSNDPEEAVIGLALPSGPLGVDDVQAQQAKIANAAGVPKDQVRITPARPGDVKNARITITKRDRLAESTPWPGPQLPIGSGPYTPVPVGQYKDGTVCALYPKVHWLVVGTSGSGKSSMLRILAPEWSRMTGIVLWVSDPVKGLQTVGAFLPMVDWLAPTPKGSKAMIRAALAVARARNTWMGERRIFDWTPAIANELPLLVIVCEEAADTIGDLPDFVKAVEQCRSAGIRLYASMQRASFDRLDTSARAEFQMNTCFGTGDAQDAGFVLPDWILDTGIDPEAWGTDYPGRHVTNAPMIARERRPMDVRNWHASDQAIADAVEEGRMVRSSLDALSQAAAGTAYAKRHDALRVVCPTDADTPDTDFEDPEDDMDPDDTPEPDTDFEDDMPDEEDPLDPDEYPIPGRDPEDEADLRGVTADTPCPEFEGEDVPFDMPGVDVPDLTQEQANAALDAVLDALVAEGRTEDVRPGDIAKRFPYRKRPWLSKALSRLVDEGRVENTGYGRYTIHPRVDGADS